MTLFHLYAKRTPFSEVDRFMLATSCTYLGCKVEAYHLRMSDFAQFYHERKKGGPRKRKPFEEVAAKLIDEMTLLELQIIKMIEFDFDFDTPYSNLREFRDRFIYFERDPNAVLNLVKQRIAGGTSVILEDFHKACLEFYGLLKKAMYRSYILPLCLYFPAPVIAGSIILIVNHIFKL
jgi:hypothetical protein